MDPRSGIEQEREIKDLIRRARFSPDKTGPLRRETLNRLIDLTRSQHTNLKVLAAQNYRYFQADFPLLEEATINAIYDLCEDPSPRVRMEGYTAITQASNVNSHWVKRNADVLLQLLQSDAPDEVAIVKKALLEHLDLDPKVTLGVLCDQITPPDDTMDEEEQTIRVRLRSLVLAFLTGEAKRAIVTRHAVPGSAAENSLINCLLLALPKLDFEEAQPIVKDLLLPLSAFKQGSSSSALLTQTLLDKVSEYLRSHIRSGDVAMLQSAMSYLDLVHFIVVTKRAAPAIQLLRFYCTSIATKITLQTFPKDMQPLVVCSIAETLAVSLDVPQPTDGGVPLDALGKQVVDFVPFLLEALAINSTSNRRLVEACKILLDACLQRKQQTAWSLPQNLAAALGALEAAVAGTPFLNIQNLITSLRPRPQTNLMPYQSKDHHLHPSLPAKPQTNSLPPLSRRTSTPAGRLSPAQYGSSSLSGARTLKRSQDPVVMHLSQQEPSIRPQKRPREDNMEIEPSLLKRLGSTDGRSTPRLNTLLPPRDLESVESVVGFSIKGAASKSSLNSTPPRKAQTPTTSLLDRLAKAPLGERLGRSRGGS